MAAADAGSRGQRGLPVILFEPPNPPHSLQTPSYSPVACTPRTVAGEGLGPVSGSGPGGGRRGDAIAWEGGRREGAADEWENAKGCHTSIWGERARLECVLLFRGVGNSSEDAVSGGRTKRGVLEGGGGELSGTQMSR